MFVQSPHIRVDNGLCFVYIYACMMNNNSKRRRQELLKAIIDTGNVGDQSMLLNKLKEEGVETTQATISRDLQELGLVKVRIAPGVYKYEMLKSASKGKSHEQLMLLFRSFVIGLKSTKNMILIKTSPGNADGVASLLDCEGYDEILGTIAGDDTILVIIDTERNRKKIEYEFQTLRG